MIQLLRFTAPQTHFPGYARGAAQLTVFITVHKVKEANVALCSSYHSVASVDNKLLAWSIFLFSGFIIFDMGHWAQMFTAILCNHSFDFFFFSKYVLLYPRAL